MSRNLLSKLFTVLSSLLLLISAQNITQQQINNAHRTLSIGFILFPGFQPLDVYGPLSLLYKLASTYKLTLSTISFSTGPVSTRVPPVYMSIIPGRPHILSDNSYQIAPETVATHTFATAPALDIILVPGGFGSATLIEKNNTQIERFLRNRFDKVDYVLGVCSGALHLARAGLLDGKKATTNKALWDWATSYTTLAFPDSPALSSNATGEAKIDWQPSARWVDAGKIWTSSGVQAGMDMMYAWLREVYGDTEVLKSAINQIEYAPHTDAHWDPFAVVHKVSGADKNGNMVDCVRPVGY